MNCKHQKPFSENSYICEIDLFGGRPSKGTCDYCIKNGKNTTNSADSIGNNDEIKTLQKIKNLKDSLTKWASNDFPIPDPETFNARLETCKGCEFWDESGFAKTGRCKKCGCSTQAKLRMTTEKCPVGKW